jgi:XapX domain-containing protein
VAHGELTAVPYARALAAGALVGLLYAALRVRSPAPPPVALLGLLGMVAGQALLEAL